MCASGNCYLGVGAGQDNWSTGEAMSVCAIWGKEKEASAVILLLASSRLRCRIIRKIGMKTQMFIWCTSLNGIVGYQMGCSTFSCQSCRK